MSFLNNFLKVGNNTYVQFVKYFFASGMALFVDFSLLFILTDFVGVYYILSATISFIAGLITAYILSKKFIFAKSSISNTKAEFLVFAAIGIAGLIINNLMLWTLTDKLGFYYMYSKFFTAFVTYLWNFFARKYIIFN
ncbi:MAG: GtrA family protein [Endomicrobia bacterium]|nr:GtrA family protein [Endomicrobiia bacterium]MCL2507072.1 GtrA family protein [Endomicrobiia bacterium]